MTKKIPLIFLSGLFILIKLILAGTMILYLTGCSCRKYCAITRAASRLAMGSDATSDLDCDQYCRLKEEGAGAAYSAGPSQEPGDSVAGVGYPLPQKKNPQEISGEAMSNVFSAGPTFSFMSTDGDMNYEGVKSKGGIGVQFGFGTALPFSPVISVAPSIRFKQLSASETISYSSPGSPGYESKTTSAYNYLGANLLAQFRVSTGLRVLAGPEITCLLSASTKDVGSSGSGEKQKITGDSQKAGVDLLAGFKYEIPARNKRSQWGLSLIYDHRLSRVNKKQTDGYDVPALKMKGLQLGIAYFWRKIPGK